MNDSWRGHRTAARRRFLAGVICGVILVFVTEFVINRTSFADLAVQPLLRPDTPGPSDAIVVLGAGVTATCAANQNALRRVLLAVRLWREYRPPHVLFTGGTGHQPCPVAVVMADLAREFGLPDAQIRVERGSWNTKQNAELSAPILRALGAKRLLLVTDRLHMRRAERVFTRAGFDVRRASVPIYESHIDNASMLRGGLREFAALAYYRVRGWTGPAPVLAAPIGEAGGTGAPGSAPEQSMRAIRNPEGPIVILGASYAGSWGLTSIGGVPVINRGVAGQQSSDMLERFEPDVTQANPRAVVIWGFINDISRSAPETLERVQAQVRENYSRMIELARRHQIEPVLATEATMRIPDSWSETIASWIGPLLGKQSYQDRVNRHVMETNRWIADVAAREGLLLLDLHGVLSDAKGNRRAEFAQGDGSHITEAGYAAVTAYARPLLESRLVNRQQVQ